MSSTEQGKQVANPHREPERDVGVLLHELHELPGVAGVVQEGTAILHVDALRTQHTQSGTPLPEKAV